MAQVNESNRIVALLGFTIDELDYLITLLKQDSSKGARNRNILQAIYSVRPAQFTQDVLDWLKFK